MMLKIMAFISFTTAAGIIAVMGHSDPDTITLSLFARLFNSSSFWTVVFLVTVILMAIDKILFSTSALMTLTFDYLENRQAMKKKISSQGTDIQVTDQL